MKARVKKIILNGYGSILRMEKGCYVVQNGKEIRKYPMFEQEIGEVVLKSGNTVTVGVLASLGFWEIDTMVMTRRGKPIAMLRSLEYDSHVKTRLCQYEAYNNHKAFYIAKQITTAKIKGQNTILKKHDLNIKYSILEKLDRIQIRNPSSSIREWRKRFISIEGKNANHYFNQIFKLFPEQLQPEIRKTYKAYDGLNNLFNLAYEILKWKVHIALIKAKLEPYLGFVHSLAHGKPSLVCDFQDLYRYLIDEFLIEYCQKLRKKDFILKWKKQRDIRKWHRERQRKWRQENNEHYREYERQRYLKRKDNPEYQRKKKIQSLISSNPDKYPLDSECVFCGSTKHLQHSHYSYDESENYITACVLCHYWMDRKPIKTT